MPAAIAHMTISRLARQRVKEGHNSTLAEFAANVLEKHPHYMELGSLGPDLPYYTWKSLCNPRKPTGVDPLSYQLHSRNPNVFPLQMIELVWRESDLRAKDWDDWDDCKFSFICGFLTHMAADQVIHPLVNFIAGPYYRSHDAREEHRTCEIHQDLYMLSQKYSGTLTNAQWEADEFCRECDVQCETRPSDALTASIDKNEFIYFLQKAFVEAHAVTPSARLLRRRIWFMQWALSRCKSQKWYKGAYTNLFDPDGKPQTGGEEYGKYISLQKSLCKEWVPKALRGKSRYDDFVNEALDLAVVYIRAAHQLYRAPRLNDGLRNAFKNVVINADLGSPLQVDILGTATAAMSELEEQVDHEWAQAAGGATCHDI